MFGSNFLGGAKQNRVNLSTATSSTSADLFGSIRAEREAREQRKKDASAAVVVQRYIRGYLVRREVREVLLRKLDEPGGSEGVEKRGRLLMMLSHPRQSRDSREAKALEEWSGMASLPDPAARCPAGIAPILHSDDWAVVLGRLCTQILRVVALDPKTVQSSNLLAAVDVLLDPSSYAFLPPDKASAKDELVVTLARYRYVELLVEALEELIAASLPKNKHPLLLPVVRLLTAPFALSPTASTALVPPIINQLLPIPALLTSIPIASLTHLSATLPLFPTILPFAGAHPETLEMASLSQESGRTYFLANLATFGITGGMLGRFGANGAMAWMKVIGVLLREVREGWGRWLEGVWVESVDVNTPMGSDDEDGGPPSRGERSRTSSARSILPQNISNKVLLLASPAHMATMSSMITSPSVKSPTSLVMDFATFALGLLDAFRGTPKWEGILESLLAGDKGWPLTKRLWREGVRSRWTASEDKTIWEHIAENPNLPCLLLLTHLYCHYLLITPDDEFFAESTSNPLTLGEVLDLAAIWRNLAFWAYMSGVSRRGEGTSGTEEQRSLLTRGVTRIAERNARRKFAPDDFWVMISGDDLKPFIEAAVFEDAELAELEQVAEGEEQVAGLAGIRARASARWTRRRLANISPRLGLLNNLPMTVPFQTRSLVFREFVFTEKRRLGIDGYHQQRGYYHKAKIRRDHLAEDGFDQLNNIGAGLKGTAYIKFYNQFGEREAGIDGSGLFKEFLTDLAKEAFDTERGLWLANSQNELYPNPHSYAVEDHQLAWYGFMGKIIGKAIYDGILVDVTFAGFFLGKWLGRQSSLDDLNSLDPELYKGLIILKNYPKPEELAINFTITEEEFGARNTIDLVPGGADIAVTAANRHEYIQLVCHYKLDKQISRQSKAFFNGLSEIIDPKWLRLFDQKELQQLVGGEETPIDVDDLKAYTEMTGFPNGDTMNLFWRVVKKFSQEEKKALLRFVTSCSRAPLLGFKYLNPPFGVQCTGSETTRLPSASACFNLLKLPAYQDEKTLKSKLLQAITSGAGFDLS